MSQTLVSIIVPVYNVEKYLDRCINSLVNQTYPHLEIILVDDCSPDCSPQMCDEWARKDNRIRVIHKEKNEGLGMARNTGLDSATGIYICFFDSDDYILEHAIERVLHSIERENADLAVFGLRNIASDGTEVSSFAPQVGEYTYREKEVLDNFLPDFIAPDPTGKTPRLFYMSSCLIMYSVEALRKAGWHFVSERIILAEDVYSLLDLLDKITSATIVPEALYCYCYNNYSLSRSYVPNRYERILACYLETLSLCKKKNYSPDIIHRISKPYLANTLSALKQIANAPLSFCNQKSAINRILRDNTLQQVLKQNRRDYVSTTRRIMFFFMRRKSVFACFLLLKLKKQH